MPGSTCHLCRGWGGAHFHWCIAVGGPGHKPGSKIRPLTDLTHPGNLTNVGPAAVQQDAVYVGLVPTDPEQPSGGGEPPVGPTPAPAATSPVVPPVRPDPIADAWHQRALREEREHLASSPVGRPRGRTTIAEPEHDYPRTEARKIVALRDRLATSTPAERWRWLAGEAGNADWAKMDDDELGNFAHRLAAFVRDHGLPITVKIRDDVLAVQGFDEEAVRAALLHPEHVEVRPESWDKVKRYPVLALRRGDVVVIVGLRQPDAPAVIAAYWTSLLSGYDPTAHRDRTGGGGAKGTGGQPTTIKALVKRLMMMGAHVDPEWSTTDEPVPVFYQGQDLGKIPVSPRTPKAEIESAWSRISRRMHAIDQRGAS